MIVSEQPALPRNTETGYDRQLQQALIGWMRPVAYAVNSLLNATSSGGGSVLSALVTVTVPSAGRIEHVEAVTFTGCTTSMRVIASLAPTVDSDENGAETLDIQSLSVTPGTDAATVALAFGERTSGPIKINLMAV